MHSDFPFTFADVRRINGLPDGGGRASEETICPICGNDKLNISYVKGIAHCFGCGHGFNALTYHKALNPYVSKPYQDILSRMGQDVHTTAPKQYKAKDQEAGLEKLAPIEVRDKTYMSLLSCLSLYKDHKADLIGRGFNDVSMYRSISGDVTKDPMICKKLLSMGCQLKGVPGFYFDGEIWHMSYVKRGILVPYFNSVGQIQGMQIRKDNNTLRVKSNGKKENKYTWLTSTWIPKGAMYGTKAETFGHYACNFAYDHDTKHMVPVILDENIILTEGAMKADLIHQLTGFPVIAIPGVNNYDTTRKLLAEIKQYGVKCVKQGFDMDSEKNPQVKQCLEKSVEIIHENGFKCNRLKWHTEVDGHYLKGLDDYYAYITKKILR